MMVMRIITILIITILIIIILIIIFDSVEISKPEYELTTLSSSKQVSTTGWKLVPLAEECSSTMGAGGTALLGRRQSVVGSRGGRVYIKSSRVVATMGGAVGRRRTGRNSSGSMSTLFK